MDKKKLKKLSGYLMMLPVALVMIAVGLSSLYVAIEETSEKYVIERIVMGIIAIVAVFVLFWMFFKGQRMVAEAEEKKKERETKGGLIALRKEILK